VRTERTIAALLLACTASTATAEPTSPIEILCKHETLVFGTVEGAHSHDCRLHSTDASCWARGIVGVDVSLDETVPPSKEYITSHFIQIAIRTHNDLPPTADPEVVRWDNSVPGVLGLPGTGTAATDLNAGKMVGDEFALALDRQDFRSRRIPEPYSAAAFSMTDEKWIRATWASAECQKLRQQYLSENGEK
jgi:hypothetical protein